MTPSPSYDDTSGLEDARKAVEDSKKRHHNDQKLVEDVVNQISFIRQIREENNFANKFRRILRGNA